MGVVVQVTDGVYGRPAAGLPVRLYRESGGEWQERARCVTDADGQATDWGGRPVESGLHRLVFDVGGYFASLGVEPFFPRVDVTFRVIDPAERYEMPLLITPHFFSASHKN